MSKQKRRTDYRKGHYAPGQQSEFECKSEQQTEKFRGNKNSDFFIKPQKTKTNSRNEFSHNVKGQFGNNVRQGNKEDNLVQDDRKEKKPFDKKKWRLKKYSNKYKMEQWEDIRKKKVLQQYYKEANDETQGFDVQKIYAEHEEDSENESLRPLEGRKSEDNIKEVEKTENETVQNTDTKITTKGKRNTIQKAQEEFLRLKQEKINAREEAKKKKAEKEEARKLYKQQRVEKYKKLNKKTKKGQPIMKHRLEMLYEKIQKSCQEQL